MQTYCGNCFQDTLNDRGICNVCGFDNNRNLEKSPHALPPGSILNGRYIIGRVLGQGGFGITYTAQDYQTKALVAIKEFFPDSMATRSGRTSVVPFSGDRGENFGYGRDSFLREAQTMAEFIGNPNIVRVYSYFEENGTAYFVMEYVDGMNLYEYLRTRGGRISFEEALELLIPVMDALSAVHEKGIIHRDVSPDNIYISGSGTVKLLDFGAARYSLGNVSRSLDVILKHGFAPKEQYKRRGHQGPYTDVYSLGSTFYYAITGVKPDDAIERSDEDDMPYPTSLGALITPQQEAVLLKAMAVDYQDRYQTMAEFKDAIFQGASRKTSVKPESLFKDISPRRTHPETQNPPQENISSGPEKKPQSQEATATKKSPKGMIASAFVILIGIISIILGLSSGTSSESVSLSARETIPATMPTEPVAVSVPLEAPVPDGTSATPTIETVPSRTLAQNEFYFNTITSGNRLAITGENIKIMVTDGKNVTVTLTGLDVKDSYVTDFASNEKGDVEYWWCVQMYSEELSYWVATSSNVTSPGSEFTKTPHTMKTELCIEKEEDKWYGNSDIKVKMEYTQNSMTWTYTLDDSCSFDFLNAEKFIIRVKDISQNTDIVQTYFPSHR